jgi:hypothetical protein
MFTVVRARRIEAGVTDGHARTVSDPDIGLCDDCGTEEGPRARVWRIVSLQGERVRIAVWLCGNCREDDEAQFA